MKRNILILVLIALMLTIAGCTSKSKKMENKEKGAESDARITLTKKYTDCVSKAGTDKAAAEGCDAILESIKKLK